jgi:signal transduction histidine kinase
LQANRLRVRIILWYVAIALAMLAVTVPLLVRFSVGEVADKDNLSARNAAQTVARSIGMHEAHGTSLEEASRYSLEPYRRGSIFVIVFDRSGKVIASTKPPASMERTPDLLLWFVPPMPPQRLVIRGGWIIVGSDSTAVRLAAERLRGTVAVLAIFALVGASLIGALVANQSLKPLLETTTSLERFAKGDFSPHAVKETDRSEFGRLAKAYNGAVKQITTAFAERDNREAQMRQFVADAGHQLRTPLTVVMANVNILISGDCTAEESQLMLAAMLHESRRMRALIDKLILLARLEHVQQPEIAVIDLAEIVEEAVLVGQAVGPGEVDVSVESRPLVRGNADEIKEALINVLENALKYSAANNVRVRLVRSNGEACITVTDRGRGIAASELPRIFDRFYRGSNAESIAGSGLGLTIAKKAVLRANGRIDVDSEERNGTTVLLRFPTEAIQEIS